MGFEIRKRIYFDEGDPGGIVFFANYLTWAHRAIEEFVESIGIPWKAWYESKEYGVPLRHVEVEYLSPLFPGTELRLCVDVKKVGNSSVVFQVSFFRGEKECGRVQTTHVFIDLKEKKKRPIPDLIRDQLTSQVES